MNGQGRGRRRRLVVAVLAKANARWWRQAAWPAVIGLVGVGFLAGCDRLPRDSDGTERAAPVASTTGTPVEDAAAVPTVQAPPPVVAPPAVDGQGAVPSFAPLVERVTPAVLLVRGFEEKTNAFGRAFVKEIGVGTGFIYDARGFVLTNNHVIKGATSVEVKLADGRKLDASRVGTDPPTDVAVLRLDEDEGPFPHLDIGDSAALRVGDWVVAIGNPFGLEHTVSAGILSAKGRTGDDVRGLDPAGYFSFLQTDASINPGNSGGPLLNLAGQVVGMNAAVRADANSIGFAIPMRMVLKLLPLLLRDGKVVRSALGIVADDLRPEDVAQGLKEGARVVRVKPGEAGDRAGLARGDVVVAFDGQPVRSHHELRWLASISGVGKTVTMKVRRGARVFDMRVTLRELAAP